MEPRFVVDTNVGRLARWLRMMGYDALFIHEVDDKQLVAIALDENRVLLTRDTQIMRRRVVTSGKLKVILVKGDDTREQLRQVVRKMGLNYEGKQFTRCLECNQPLVSRTKEEVRDRVPPYVFKTQTEFVECPTCHRIYWRGTHWQRMKRELATLMGEAKDDRSYSEATEVNTDPFPPP
jgi:uncharacterized protein with PIN domain